MIKSTYLQRLNSWNSSQKYLQEVKFLELLLDPSDDDVILDYGCGTGYCIKLLSKNSKAKYYGFDINKFFGGKKSPDWFLDSLQTEIKFSKIYFMHSIAHIENISEVLQNIKKLLKNNGHIYVITPNKEFDDYFKMIKDPNYQPDPTVVKHYTIEEIVNLIESSGYYVEVVGQFGKKVNNFQERIFTIASFE